MKESARITVLLGLLVFLSIHPVQGSFVRCIGSDGHDKIELAIQGNCFSGSTHKGQPEKVEPLSIDDHCPDCIDIPFRAHEAQFHPQTWKSTHQNGFSQGSFYFSNRFAWSNFRIQHFFKQDQIGNFVTQQLRTVRLLI